MTQENTPPRDDQTDDYGLGEIEEVYEIGDDDNLDFLEEDEEHDDEAGDEDVGHSEDLTVGDEEKTNPIVYSNHKGSVFCCTLSPSGEIGASGGEDDIAYVWNVETATTLFECTGHKDSVTNVAFSHDGTYLATGDMGGLVKVWKISTQASVWEFETDDLNWMLWHPSSSILFAGTSQGEVWMWLIPRGNTKSLSHSGVSAECGALTRDGKRICVGHIDGTVKILDLKSGQTLQSLACHEEQITSIATHQDNTLILSGSTDCKTKLINGSAGKEIATLCGDLGDNEASAAEEDYDNTVEVVTFCPSNPNLAVTASLSGIITIWDISSQVSRHHIVQGCGVASIIWHPAKPYFFTAGLDGILRVFDVRSAEQLFKFKGHRSEILSCDINKDGSKVVTSSDDGTVRILSMDGLWT